MRTKIELGESEESPFKANCSYCGKALDGQMTVNDRGHQPKVGDVSICMYCQHLAVYTGPDDVDGKRQPATGFREPTESELEYWLTVPKVRIMLYATGQVMKKHWKHTVVEEKSDAKEP